MKLFRQERYFSVKKNREFQFGNSNVKQTTPEELRIDPQKAGIE